MDITAHPKIFKRNQKKLGKKNMYDVEKALAFVR